MAAFLLPPYCSNRQRETCCFRNVIIFILFRSSAACILPNTITNCSVAFSVIIFYWKGGGIHKNVYQLLIDPNSVFTMNIEFELV